MKIKSSFYEEAVQKCFTFGAWVLVAASLVSLVVFALLLNEWALPTYDGIAYRLSYFLASDMVGNFSFLGLVKKLLTDPPFLEALTPILGWINVQLTHKETPSFVAMGLWNSLSIIVALGIYAYLFVRIFYEKYSHQSLLLFLVTFLASQKLVWNVYAGGAIDLRFDFFANLWFMVTSTAILASFLQPQGKLFKAIFALGVVVLFTARPIYLSSILITLFGFSFFFFCFPLNSRPRKEIKGVILSLFGVLLLGSVILLARLKYMKMYYFGGQGYDVAQWNMLWPFIRRTAPDLFGKFPYFLWFLILSFSGFAVLNALLKPNRKKNSDLNLVLLIGLFTLPGLVMFFLLAVRGIVANPFGYSPVFFCSTVACVLFSHQKLRKIRFFIYAGVGVAACISFAGFVRSATHQTFSSRQSTSQFMSLVERLENENQGKPLDIVFFGQVPFDCGGFLVFLQNLHKSQKFGHCMSYNHVVDFGLPAATQRTDGLKDAAAQIKSLVADPVLFFDPRLAHRIKIGYYTDYLASMQAREGLLKEIRGPVFVFVLNSKSSDYGNPNAYIFTHRIAPVIEKTLQDAKAVQIATDSNFNLTVYQVKMK